MQMGQPIVYIRKGLKGRALHFLTFENELLIVVMVVQRWRPYALGQQFEVKIDQKALKILLEQREGAKAQQKWITKLLGFNFTIEHKTGKEHSATNALSRSCVQTPS